MSFVAVGIVISVILKKKSKLNIILDSSQMLRMIKRKIKTDGA